MKKISKMLASLLVLILTINTLIATKIKSEMYLFQPTEDETCIEEVVVHFIHGSIMKDNCFYKKKRLGGILGGHVEIQIDSFVYGFNYHNLPIHIFPSKHYNSTFIETLLKDWKNKTMHDQKSSVFLPVSREQKEKLLSKISMYKKNTPYDYAFLGHRCTSSVAELLSESGILNEFSDTEAIVVFFYPRTLRSALLKYAHKFGLNTVYSKGADCHIWEN